MSESAVDADVYAESGRRSAPRTGFGAASMGAVAIFFSSSGSFGGIGGGGDSREDGTSVVEGLRRSGSSRERGGEGAEGFTMRAGSNMLGGRRLGSRGGSLGVSAVLTR